MNTAACITRLTMIAAALAAGVTVQAAPAAPAAGVVEMPTVTVIGKRAAVVEMPTVVVVGKREVVEMPVVTVIGKRGGEAGTLLVAQKANGFAPVKPASRV